MQIITTHVNADFDCLASMVAANKLYPSARMVLPGSAEKSVNRYLKEVSHDFELTRLRDVDLEKVELLVLVDTQDPDRIGAFQSLVSKPGVTVHVYDHHPDAGHKIHSDFAVVKKRGATTTILVELLAEKNISLTPEESTLMVLGIYQDTHSLVSSSTTPEDLDAGARLVRMGADLNVVADFVSPRLVSEQLDVLNDLIRNLELFSIHGVEVALATATADHFVEDLAYVIHRVMDLENLSTLLGLVLMDRRVYLIGRSRLKEVNVAEIAREFGGGGHPSAASASIREMTLVQAREKLLDVLNEKVRPLFLVKDIMHFPVVSVKKNDTIQTVEKTLTRFNLNTVPVIEKDVPVGLITRQIVEKAIHHKMGKELVENLMIREFSVTTPDSWFRTIIPMVIEDKQKLVPVVSPKTGKLVGIISRGDVLRVFYGDLVREGEPEKSLLEKKAGIYKNIKSLLKERLDREIMLLLETIARKASETGYAVYVVGGFVRDLLLGIKNLDIDVVVEGDGIGFARLLGEELQGKVKSHAKFGTSVIILKNGFRIDVATARMEFYKHPAALPTVEKSSIKADLFRRDFTINTLAIRLNGEQAFCLIDYFNGERDLKDKVIRVLHNLSFIEDPCRIFRAIRFEQRFGFNLGKQTEAFMKTAIEKNMIDQLSGSRLLNELKLILQEKNPLRCIRRMLDFDLLRFISPKMLVDPESMKALERIEDVLSWTKIIPFPQKPEVWFIYFLGLFYHLDDSAFFNAIQRLRIPMRLRKRLEADRQACRETLDLLKTGTEPRPGEIYEVFRKLSPEAVIYLLSLTESERVGKYATLYYTQYEGSARLSLKGDDLIRMGLKPGPVFQEVFKTLRDARVNGRIHSREEEIALVKNEFLK